MKFYSVLFFSLLFFKLNAQIEAVKTDGGNSNSQVEDIVVVFKMHFDIGYTNLAEGVLQKYSTKMLDETLKSIDETSILPKSEQFIWTTPGWPLKYMLENCTPKNRIRLEKAIQEERIIPHALPITHHTEGSDLELLVRGLSFSSQLNRSFGLPLARDAKLTDVPSHSRVLPTILKKAGVDFLHIGCNPGSISPDIPRLFWWQGNDSSRVLTFYWSEYYGSSILPPENWNHKTWLALIHTHENSGAPTPAEVAELLKTAKEKMPNARVRIGRLSDFYDLLMKENPKLPTVTGDMPDTWIHGLSSMPLETKISKKLQRETFDTDIFNTQMNLWSRENNSIKPYIDKAVESMVLYNEHTFGIAMTHGDQHKWTYNDEFKINKSLGYYDFVESSWQEKGNRIRETERIITPLMNRQLKQLGASVAIDGKRVIVYNPLPWLRSGRVNFFAGIYQKKFELYGLKDIKTGVTIPVYNDYNLISFDAENIPSMGYKTYIPILNPIIIKSNLVLDKKNNILENKFFRLNINSKTGTLSSVFDKKNKIELVDQTSKEGFGAYFYEQIGQERLNKYNKSYVKPGSENWANDEMIRPSIPISKTRTFKGAIDKIVYLDMGNAVRATVFGKLNDSDLQQYLVTYTLYENQPYIEINWGIDGKKPNALPEAGWLSFPFSVKNPEYRLYRTGGIVDPEREFVERSNQDYYFLNTSMTLFDELGKGVVINCPDSPGISIDTPGLFKFTKKKELTTGTVFVNLFNTQWGTNFTEWIEGSFSSKMYIWNYDNYDAEKSFITPSEETRNSLKGAYYDGVKGKLVVSQQGIALSKKGIIVTSFGENIDGGGILLRLWEQSGNGGQCKINLPNNSSFKVAYPCNLRGEIINTNGIKIIDNSFKYQIGANEPVSFILR